MSQGLRKHARPGSRRLGSKTTALLLTVGVGLTPFLSACSRSNTPSSTPAPASSKSAASTTAAAGDFGTLKAVCGPGDAHGGIGRGVTASTIKIGVNADPGSSAAPGLEQEFFDTAEGFVKWCNAAGGINGRKIIPDEHDAKLFNVGQAMTAACQSDFMSVGGGNAFDSAGVKIREACKLGQIPAYVVSPEATRGKYQVQATATALNQVVLGGVRLLANAYPETMTKGVGIAGSNLASLIAIGKKNQEYSRDIGLKVPVFQEAPPTVTNYRPYMEQLRESGVAGFYAFNGEGVAPILSAVKDIGWNPSWIMFSSQFYGKGAIQAAASEGNFPPSYMQFTSLPFELADKYPVLKQTEDIVQAAAPSSNLDTFTELSMSALLLWAQSAKACGSDLTSDCVLAKAKAHTDWTAGGLFPPQNVQADSASPCVAMLRLTSTGFQYDEKVTAPTPGDAPYNCDPQNEKQVQTYEGVTS